MKNLASRLEDDRARRLMDECSRDLSFSGPVRTSVIRIGSCAGRRAFDARVTHDLLRMAVTIHRVHDIHIQRGDQGV